MRSFPFTASTIVALLPLLTNASPPLRRDQATCLLTGYNYVDQQHSGGQFMGGGPDGASIAAQGWNTGFDFRYSDGHAIAASQYTKVDSLHAQGGTNPIKNGQSVIPAKELRFPSDITWDAGFQVSYQSCSANGVKGNVDAAYCNKVSGSTTLCSACTVELPCPTGLGPPAKKCQVNAVKRDSWGEHGLMRYRTVFSASPGVDVSKYCDEWSICSPLWSNIQCGFDDKVDGGTWRVDVSSALGSQGMYDSCYTSTLHAWAIKANCSTGDFNL